MAEGVGNWGDLREESWQLRSLLTWKFDEDWILLCITVYAFFIWYVPLFVNGRENFCWLFWGGTCVKLALNMCIGRTRADKTRDA